MVHGFRRLMKSYVTRRSTTASAGMKQKQAKRHMPVVLQMNQRFRKLLSYRLEDRRTMMDKESKNQALNDLKIGFAVKQK